ncbi:hypothetical protein OPU71_05855 [Niveibacterium sp. 24ML]|uniref:hypothetical protein n=1 Tax=Niveibacterium sp. 24ML TaxID=2985512 RepID=UPI002270424A|nr:hypothetical protein [Niveibacterium sp. 24ML]MCX9155647.1 hypothetical protein [Niveibacterium sp. 24ML]
MNSGYKIVISGVQPGYAEEQVAKDLAPLLRHSAEQLLPALRSKQAISLSLKGSDSLLTAARALKENVEKCGCACSLASLSSPPPKAPDLPGKFDHLNLRRFVNTKVGLTLDAPGYWRDASKDALFRIEDTGADCWFTASLNRSPGVDLMVWAEIRFGVVPAKMDYLKPYREPYSLNTNAGPAVVAEFRGTAPGDENPQHHLVMCLRPEAGAVSLNITTSVASFEQNQALYQWLLRTQLRLVAAEEAGVALERQLYESPLDNRLIHLKNPPEAFWENHALINAGARRAAVRYGENTFIHRRKYYSTSLTNKSDRPIRVLKFGGFRKEGNSVRLGNFTGAWFTAQDFIEWYGVSNSGWIQPGETVTDDSNYGGDDEGFWAYWCCNGADERFMAMAHHSKSLTGGQVFSLNERQPGMPADPFSPCPEGIAKRLQGFTNNCLELARDHAGREIGLDEGGVRWLDQIIEQQREHGDPANQFNLLQVFGAFLGDCIIRKSGGVWGRYDEAICVQSDEGAIFPFNKVAKQFENGREGGDSVLGLYQTIGVFRRNALTLRQQRFSDLFSARHDFRFFVPESGSGTESWARVTRIEGHSVTIQPEWLSSLPNAPTISVMLDQINRFQVTDAQGELIDLDQVDIPPSTSAPALSPSSGSPRTHVGSPADETMGNALKGLRLAFAQNGAALRGYALESVKASCPRWMKPQDPLFGFFEKQVVLLNEGRIVWAALVQANRLLFSPGPDDCPADLVWSDDPYFDTRPQELRGIGRRISQLKNTTPSNPEERKIAEQITDEVTRSLGWKLPRSLTDRDVYSTTFMVFRKHIPNGTLTAGCFPILTHPSTQFVMIVPFEFWPIDLIRLWKDGRL